MSVIKYTFQSQIVNVMNRFFVYFPILFIFQSPKEPKTKKKGVSDFHTKNEVHHFLSVKLKLF